MAQDSRPVADFAAPTSFYAGSATFPGPPAPNVSDLYQTVDETVASDADGIVLQSSGGTAWFTMGSLSSPTEIILYVRSGGHNSSGVVTTATLYEPDGTTLIDSQMFVPFSNGVLETKSVEFDISGGVSDPSALVLKLEQGSSLGSGGYVYTTQLYLYDSGAGSGGSSGGAIITDVHLGTAKNQMYDRFAYQDPQMPVRQYVVTGGQIGSKDWDNWWQYPISPTDAEGAIICPISGYKFPARMKVQHRGTWYGAPFAPRDR